MTDALDSDLGYSGLQCPMCGADLWICLEASRNIGEPWLHCKCCLQIGTKEDWDKLARISKEPPIQKRTTKEPRQMSLLIPEGDIDDLI